MENHQRLERNVYLLIVMIVLVSSVGAIVQILPLFKKEIAIERVSGMRPHTPLELAGFEIYKREGCYNCHSQQIRYLRDEVERYGHYSLAAESMYDYPFQWGSKRTGPDLARIGGKYSEDWHIEHLINPRLLVPESIMPSYHWLATTKLDIKDIQRLMEVLRIIGVPYSQEDIDQYKNDIELQLGFNTDEEAIASFRKRYATAMIKKFDNKSHEITEMDAVVGYLQSLGNRVDLKTNQGRDW